MNKRMLAAAMAAVMGAGMLSGIPLPAKAAEKDYELYPTPQQMEYQDGDYILEQQMNVVYEEGVDAETKARVAEIAALKEIRLNESEEPADGGINLLIGTADNEDKFVDNYVSENAPLKDAKLFQKHDSYVLDSKDGTIAILGGDNDSSFYGATTLYHIVKQLESYTIRNFHIEDYADVVSRGFIEGYYGEPWSTQDRVNLMKWGGYYKLNSYLYAPKDDPKHNRNWREMYTQQELAEKITPLAESGNESKCRFVYALHPFMYNPIRFDGNYTSDLKVLEDKFAQVIECGVRQIAILADDAGNVGANNYIKLLTDMSAWLKEKQDQYPELKLTLPFCTQEYMYNGEAYYKQFPEKVQIIMTGGKIWGEVSQQFTDKFTVNAGRGPYMWINWPCSDNSKNHLIMGGYSQFLHPGLDPEKLQGIVLNPMQQSEPSKVAIFGNACYSWNIWKDEAEANRAWEDSFKYVVHNSAMESEGSNALRELSKHMINQAMDGRVAALQESVELKKILHPFKAKLADDSYTEEEIKTVEAEFEKLQEAALTFESLAGETRLKNQIVCWLDCWKDTTKAALFYLDALRACKAGDASALVSSYTEGQQAFGQSKTHGFSYIDHTEYAEVGVQHIVPFIKAMESYLSRKVQEVADPTVVTQTYISDVFTKPYAGSFEDALDGKDETAVVFHEPLYVKTNNYIGVEFSKPTEVHTIRFALGGGKNHFYGSKIEYTKDGMTWEPVNNEIYSRPLNSEEPIEITGLTLKDVKGVRLIATEDNGVDSWTQIKSIDINKEIVTVPSAYDVKKVELEKAVVAAGAAGNAVDKNKGTELHLKTAIGQDNIKKDAAVVLDLGAAKEIGSVYVAQGLTAENDIPDSAVVEYSTDKSSWKEFGELEKKTEQTVYGNAEARYIRIRNEQDKNVWWRIAEIQVFSPEASQTSMSAAPIHVIIGKHQIVNDSKKNNKFEYIVDGDKNTLAWMAAPDNGNIQNGQGVEIQFSKSISMKEISILQGEGDKVSNLKVEYKDTEGWKELKTVADAGAKVIVDAKGTKASAIRLTNAGGDTTKWWQLYEVSVIESAKPTKEPVMTNVKTKEAEKFLALAEEGEMTLQEGSITLKKDEYIGLDLGAIQKLTALEAKGAQTDKAELQASKNHKVWNNVEKAEGTKASYVRLVNTGTQDQKLTIESLKAAYVTVGRFGEFVSSDIDAIQDWGDSRENGKGFDKDMATFTKLGGCPQAGNSVVYSFGQDIDVNSLRIYTVDSQQDYIRDAKIQLSVDGKDWETVLIIGDGVTDTDRETPFGSISDSEKKTDSNHPNYMYYGNDEVGGKKARYMRILITAAYPTRALAVNEVKVNNWAYVSQEGNQAFTGMQESEGNPPSNMLDKDLITVYQGSAENGSMTYDLSKPDGIRSFRLIQNGKASNAVVTAELYNENDGTVSKKEVGTLAQTINEFRVPEGKSLLSVNVSWKKVIPKISELITLTKEAEMADKSELEKLVNEVPKEYDSWTTSSKAAYDEVKAMAQEVLKSEDVSASTVQSAVAGMKKAIEYAEKKANTEALQKLADEKVENQNLYTGSSYAGFESAIAKAQEALKNADDLSEASVAKLVQDIEEAKAALKYSIRNREKAEILIKTYKEDLKDQYTTASFQAWKNSYEEVKKLVEKDKAAADEASRVHPEAFVEPMKAYEEVMKNLVHVSE